MIDVAGLRYRYPGASTDALCGVSMKIPPGSFTAIMGANGSGKSTLSLCLAGLLLPTEGTVVVDGTSASAAKKGAGTISVGIVFQDPRLQFASVTVERELAFGLENLAVPSHEMHRRVAQQLEVFGLTHLRDAPPQELSTGEQQRLALASMIILNPRYLILDEATSLLAPDSRRKILHHVLAKKEADGMAVVMVTQFEQEARLAEQRLMLHEGRILPGRA